MSTHRRTNGFLLSGSKVAVALDVFFFFFHRANFNGKPGDETPDTETTDSPRFPWKKGGAERREIAGRDYFLGNSLLWAAEETKD